MEERSEQTYAPVRRNSVTVTAVVPTFNEEAHIGTCLLGLLRQEGVPGDVEILVVDGGSRDRTVDIVRSFPEYGQQLRLIHNPHKLQVYAWNAGMREARGEYYAMISAHAEYGPRYLAECLEVIRRTGAAAVGGVQRPYGEDIIGRTIACCMSSGFGIGNARFRYTSQEEETDSVFAMFTRRDTLERLGGFDESLPFDEDSDLNYRIRSSGGKLVVSPSIHVRYAVRRSLRALWKQMYRYGYWRRFTQMKHPREVPLRIYAPALLITGLAVSVALAATPVRPLALVVPGAYAVFLGVAVLAAMRRTGFAAPLVPLALSTMHVSYGTGWLTAVVRTLSRKRR